MLPEEDTDRGNGEPLSNRHKVSVRGTGFEIYYTLCGLKSIIIYPLFRSNWVNFKCLRTKIISKRGDKYAY